MTGNFLGSKRFATTYALNPTTLSAVNQSFDGQTIGPEELRGRSRIGMRRSNSMTFVWDPRSGSEEN